MFLPLENCVLVISGVFIAPACSRVRYRRPIFRPSVNIYVDVRHLCQS